MKKLGLLFSVLTIALFANGQVTLEHTYSESDSSEYPEPIFIRVFDNIPEVSNVLKYILYTSFDDVYTIYNKDHSVYKKINSSLPDGDHIRASKFIFPSVHLFNTDDAIEFIMQTGRDSTYLINENGIILFNFGKRRPLFTITDDSNNRLLYVNKTSEGYKMYMPKYLRKEVNSSKNQYFIEKGYDVYSLGVNQPQSTSKKALRSKKLAHPNPANTTITLPYQLENGVTATMNIYNIKGKLIETKKIDSSFSNILLNVSDYKSGTYIYTYNNTSAKFIVE